MLMQLEKINTKQRRHMFTLLRTKDATANDFMPQYGLTLGEFAFVQVICDNNQRRRQ